MTLLSVTGSGRALAAAFGLLTLKRVRFVLRPAQEAVADEAAMRAEADVRIP